MAEVQTHTESGETARRFIEFVMMQAQNAALFLGQIPHPSGEPEINLDLAKLFIDQLAMIREKTRGNLSNDEQSVLNNAITNLQMVFVEVSQQQKEGGNIEAPAPAASVPEVEAPSSPAGAAPGPEPAQGGEETKKKFSKSYGT